MEETKKKRGRRSSTTETNNTQDGVNAGGTDVANPSPPEPGPIQFFSYDDPLCPSLPPIGIENETGRLADVAFASGYFAPATPAQLAIRMLVGEALGLSPVVALFDVELGPGGSVQYKPGQPAQTAGDAIDATAAENRRILDNAESDVNRSDNAGGDVVPFRPAEVPADVKEALAAGDWTDEANNGPVLKTEPESDADALEPKQSDPGPQSGETAAGLTPIAGDAAADDLGFPTDEPTSDEIAKAIAEFDGPAADPFESPAEPGPAADDIEAQIERDFPGLGLPASPAGINPEVLEGIEVGATIAVWRKTIGDQMRELGFATEKVVEKLATFDAGTTLNKKQMAEQCNALYLSRLGTKRSDVLIALAKDGKKSVEEMAGFFTYAEVPAEPASWTYAEALKAFKTIEREFPNLLLDPEPEPATPAAA